MKLKLIERKVGSRSQVSRITFQKNGYIRISKKAVEDHDIKIGMSLAILQDLEKPNDFYLILSNQKHEKWPMLRSDSKKDTLLCGYTDAKLVIKNQFGIDDDTFHINLGGQIKTEFGPAICLITAPFINNNRR
jgi:hypothetical protein